MDTKNLNRISSQTSSPSSWISFWGLTFMLLALQLAVDLPYVNQAQMDEASFSNMLILCGKLSIRALLFAILLASPLLFVGYTVIRRVYIGLLAVFATILYFFESYLLVANKAVYSYGILMAMAGTNTEETREYWQSFDWSVLIMPVCVFVAVVALSYLVSVIAKRIHASLPSILDWSLRVGITIVSFVSIVYLQPTNYDLVDKYAQINAMASTPWERVVWNTYGFLEDAEAQRQGAEKIKSINLGNIGHHQLPPHNLVLILGESLRSDYMHLYGYPIQNTPKQDSLLATGNLVVYADAVAPVPGTVGAITRIMTFLRNETQQHDWFNYAALTEVMEHAGYRSAWTTNQETMGEYVQPIGTLLSLADDVKVVNVHSNREGYRNLYPDEDVLPELKTAKEGESLFQVVHLLGSHQDYKLRYPKQYARFTAKDTAPIHNRGEERDSVIATYLNTVYYNDYVVSEIVRKYEDTPSIIIYLSDHGQALYDNQKQPELLTHGLVPEAVRVPLWFYISPKLQEQVPHIKELIASRREQPIMLDIFPNSLCGLLGIKHQLDSPQFDFFSSDYNAKRRRMVLGFEGGATLDM